LIANEEHHVVSCLPEFLSLELQVPPGVEPSTPVRSHPIVATKDPSKVRDHVSEPRRVPFDVRINRLKVEIAAGEEGNSLWAFIQHHRPDQLHVLLRHRLLP